jgi:hypothetical protein
MNIGFMQGRLSKMVDGKIQAFPVLEWREEFSRARKMSLRHIEWTLDHKNLFKNPIMTSDGRSEIDGLVEQHGVE